MESVDNSLSGQFQKQYAEEGTAALLSSFLLPEDFSKSSLL